jgi:hypothetical protein
MAKCDCCNGDIGRVVYYTKGKRRQFCKKSCYVFYHDYRRERVEPKVRYVRETPYRMGMAGNHIPSFRLIQLSRLVAGGGRGRLATPVR